MVDDGLTDAQAIDAAGIGRAEGRRRLTLLRAELALSNPSVTKVLEWPRSL